MAKSVSIASRNIERPSDAERGLRVRARQEPGYHALAMRGRDCLLQSSSSRSPRSSGFRATLVRLQIGSPHRNQITSTAAAPTIRLASRSSNGMADLPVNTAVLDRPSQQNHGFRSPGRNSWALSTRLRGNTRTGPNEGTLRRPFMFPGCPGHERPQYTSLLTPNTLITRHKGRAWAS